MTSTSPCEIQGTIRGKKPYGLGPYTDADGKRWDIRGYGMDEDGWWCWAVPAMDLHLYYTDTSTARYGFVSQRWLPYRMEIVDEVPVT